MKIEWLVARSSGMMGALLRWWPWSRWTHVAVLVTFNSGNTVVYESRAPSLLPRRRGGVVTSNFENFVARYKNIAILDPQYDVTDSSLFYSHAVFMLGKKYDWLGPIGRVLRKDIQDPKRVDCVEFLVHCDAATLNPKFRPGLASKLTQESVWSLNLPTRKVDAL